MRHGDAHGFARLRCSGGGVPPKVAAEESHTVAIKGDGSAWFTRQNNYGQLGINKTSDELPKTTTFTQCIDNTGAEISDVIDIACGANHTAVIRADEALATAVAGSKYPQWW